MTTSFSRSTGSDAAALVRNRGANDDWREISSKMLTPMLALIGKVVYMQTVLKRDAGEVGGGGGRGKGGRESTHEVSARENVLANLFDDL